MKVLTKRVSFFIALVLISAALIFGGCAAKNAKSNKSATKKISTGFASKNMKEVSALLKGQERQFTKCCVFKKDKSQVGKIKPIMRIYFMVDKDGNPQPTKSGNFVRADYPGSIQVDSKCIRKHLNDNIFPEVARGKAHIYEFDPSKYLK